MTNDGLTAAPERVRELFANTLPAETVPGISAESERRAAAYMSCRILPPRYTDDARHVAVCTVAQIEYLVNWNFKHLVNVQREAGFNAVNLFQGYRSVRIVNPLELIYGNQTKTFDAVAESRQWREATSRKLDAMSLEERLAPLESVRERYAVEQKARQSAVAR